MPRLRKPRIKRLDNFETALKKLVGNDKKSADILRKANAELLRIANPSTYNVSELTLLDIVDSAGLGPKEVKKLHDELASGEIIRTTAILMHAARSQLDTRALTTALKIPGEAERFFKPNLPNFYGQMEQFVRPECLSEFVDQTSREPDPPKPIRKRTPEGSPPSNG